MKNHNTPILENTISPYEEIVAYETLWAMEGMTEKKISVMLDNNMLPSQALRNQSGLLDFDLTDVVKRYLDNIKEDFSVSVHGDYQYPEKLRDARYPIELFYYRGDIGLVESSCVSVVGSRKCSQEGLRRARKMARLLVQNDITVVSGLAQGIDTAALEAAIDERGKVIGVIGTPINRYYPKENKKLQDLIAKKHLLISQVPFYRYEHDPFSAKKHHFPRRNATMSAISEGTVIIEAGESSGTLTQAREAIQQGRKLFILNSCFENKKISWPEKYEKKGAIRVENIKDVIYSLKKGSP